MHAVSAVVMVWYLIARVMASDEPILSAEAAKEMRCAQCNESLDVLAPGVRCRNKQKQQFACGKCLSVDARLRRLLGTWPLAEMKGCSEQDTFDFYRRAAAANGPHSLRVQLKSVFTNGVSRQSIWETPPYNIRPAGFGRSRGSVPTLT